MKNGIKNLERCSSPILYLFSLDMYYLLFHYSKLSFWKKPLSFWTIWTLKVSNSKMAHLLRRVQIDLWALTILWPWKTDIGIKNQKPNTLEAASKNSGASALRECAWINVIRKNKEQKIIKICLRPKRISVFKLIWIKFSIVLLLFPQNPKTGLNYVFVEYTSLIKVLIIDR